MSKLNTTTRELANRIRPLLTVNGDTITAPKDLYESLLDQAELDMATVERVQTHRNQFVAGYSLAVGEVGVDHMRDNKGVDYLAADVGVGGDTVAAAVRRSRSYPAPQGAASTDPVIVQGDTTVGYRVRNGAEIKVVREHLKAYALSVLAG